MKKALVVAAGVPQIALIQELKRRGIYTLVADWNPMAIAVPYADEYYPVSTLDPEGIKNLAMEQKVDFVITACADQVLEVTAHVSEELGLPCYIDHKTAVTVSDKSIMKRIFAENGVPTSPFVIAREFHKEDIAHLSYPLIVKPVDCYSSRGVRKVTNDSELQEAFEYAVSISRKGEAVIEEFIAGEELTVDLYIENGKAHLLAVSNLEKIQADGKFVIFRAVSPAVEKETMDGKIVGAAQRIVDAFGLKDSPMLMQLIVRGDEIYILEFCARTGGCIKYLLVQHASGFDVIKAVVDLTIGEKPHIESAVGAVKYVSTEHAYCREGVIDHIEGFEELQREGIIQEYFQLKNKGIKVGSINSSGDRGAAWIITAESLEELKYKQRTAAARIRICDAEGNDLARHDLLPETTQKGN